MDSKGTLRFITNGPGIPVPGGHYCAAIVANGTVYVSGCVGSGHDTGKLAPDFESQVLTTLRVLTAVLAAAGARLQDVLTTTCYLIDAKRFHEFNALYAEFFGDHRPARTTVTVTPNPGVLFEIDAIAIQTSHVRSV